jgi:putative tricarboxylic transport membrane protein
MLALNLPLRALWTRLFTLPCGTFFPGLVMLACLGILTLGGGGNLLYLAAGLALAGYSFHKLGCPVGPLLLGFVLGPFMESHLREALQTYGGWGVLLSQPLSAAFLLTAVTLLVLVMMPAIHRPRAALFKERDD